MNPKAIFSATINNKSTDSYHIKSTATIHISQTLEEEKARLYLNISLETYNSMVGGRRWIHLSPIANGGNITCKSDVLIAYRLLSSIEPIYQDIAHKQIRKR